MVASAIGPTTSASIPIDVTNAANTVYAVKRLIGGSAAEIVRPGRAKQHLDADQRVGDGLPRTRDASGQIGNDPGFGCGIIGDIEAAAAVDDVGA